jgi:opacity protein-like surface antigen
MCAKHARVALRDKGGFSMQRIFIALMLLVAMSSAGVARAQSPVGLELRGGAAIPTADLGNAELNNGAGGEFTINYRVMPHVLAYAGWDWFRVTTNTPFMGFDYDVENTGYAFGFQFQHPVLPKIDYWVRAGGIYNHIEMELDNGDLAMDSGHDLGWEVGGGVRLPITQQLAVTPGVRYRTLSTELSIGSSSVPVDLSYLTAEVGLQFTFGARRIATALVR